MKCSKSNQRENTPGLFLWVPGIPLPEASQNQGRKKPKDSKNVESILKNSGHQPNYSNVSKKQSKGRTPSNSLSAFWFFGQFVFTKHI